MSKLETYTIRYMAFLGLVGATAIIAGFVAVMIQAIFTL